MIVSVHRTCAVSRGRASRARRSRTVRGLRFPPLILCYHAVTDRWEDPLAIAPATLERQVRLLLRLGYRTVDARSSLANQPRTLHVTFDDAYRNVGAVLPALERLAVRITLFACSGFADDGRAFRVSELRHRLPPQPDELLTMSWETLRELVARGIEVGSHTVSHPHLPQLSDRELRAELTESKQRLEDELRQRCRFLAYPYGDDDARVHEAARSAGYEGAFSLRGRAGDRFAMPRVDVYRGDGLMRFALKASPLRNASIATRDALRGLGPDRRASA